MIKLVRPMPEAIAETASFLTPVEQARLWEAAVTLADSRGAVMRVTALFGRRIESWRAKLTHTGDRFGGPAWTNLTRRTRDAVEDTLWSGYDMATAGLMATPRLVRPSRPRGNPMHKIAATASGLASGFVGLPGVMFDIPFTTTTILRSIAEVARDNGEDVGAEETKRACLEVLAFGGPSSIDDETEIGYWATRIGTNHLTLTVLVKSAAARLGLVLSEKFLAQAVPVAGAVTGGALNYAFTDYYQKMARVQFCLRALDRRTGQPAAVRACFADMLRAARNRRRITRPPAQAQSFLPR
jgi:hypothetical protein